MRFCKVVQFIGQLCIYDPRKCGLFGCSDHIQAAMDAGPYVLCHILQKGSGRHYEKIGRLRQGASAIGYDLYPEGTDTGMFA